MGRINELWHLFLDLVGPRHLWPRDLPKYFWGVTDRGTRTLNYKERFRVAVFSYVNGVPLEILMEWCYRLQLLRDEAAVTHIYRLYNLFENLTVDRYSCWHVGFRCDFFTTGNRKFY